MLIKNNIIYPEWQKKFDNKIICGFTLPGIGNLSHTRESKLTSLSTYQNKINLIKMHKLDNYSIFQPFQTHSDIILDVYESNKNSGYYDKSSALEGDACITKKEEILLLTTWADCVPVIFYEFNKNIIASVHSGWKSTYKQIVNKTVNKIISLGGEPKNIYVAIGPSIKKCCYEVGIEFLEYFSDYKDCFIKKDNKLYFDTSLVVYKQMIESGISVENINFSNLCTYCSKEPEFSSFRKNPENFEGQGTFIALKK